MADVWVGHDRLLDRRVAVKILHPEFAANEAFVERFRREAQAAANLNHDNIVDIYDWGRDQGIYFMVMELIPGHNLRDLLRAEGALAPRRVAEIGVAVAAALGAAHDGGLVHRDIKPANVLLTPEGGVKVTDFGIARAWDDSDQLTRTGAVIGTATYFSPEQAQGLTADGRSDLYALGVVMYELLTGVPPFVGESPVSVAYQHVREFAPPPSDLNPNIPPALDAIVMRCLEKDPRRRYQTAGALAADLGRYLAGRVPPAMATATSEAVTRLVPPTGAPPLPPTAAAEAARGGPYREPGKPDRSTLIIGILAAVALLGLGVILLLRLLLPGGSSGTVEITDVRGQTREAAVATLEGLGLVIGDDIQVPDAEIAATLVAGTQPPAGQQVEAGSTVQLLISTGAGMATVPPLVGETEARARELLSAAGLDVAVTYEPNQVVAQGTVMSQDLESGVTVPAGTVVNLVISAGTEALTVPDVVNHPEQDAMLKLAEAGFGLSQVIVERKPSADVIPGYVIETDPPAGTTLPADGTVTITISQGPVPTVVPGVIGQTPEDARAALEDLGFVVVFGDPVDLEFGDPNNGKVTEQDPAGGQRVDFGSTVELRVGASADTIPVPNLLGQTAVAARNAIEALDLVYAEGAPLLLDSGDPYIGKVADVSPAVGTPLDPGDTVTVRIGAEGARVPDVAATTCLDPSAARNAIEAAGLVYAEGPIDDSLPVGDPCDGKVVEQSPAPFSITSTLVARGSTVTVRIGQAMVTVPDVRAWILELLDPLNFDLEDSKAAIEDAGLRWKVEECQPIPAYGAYIGKVVDQDPLGDPPGSASLPPLTRVTLYVGVASGPACPHVPPP
jgi:eukaryotic-like serine/threonine-protein kinase